MIVGQDCLFFYDYFMIFVSFNMSHLSPEKYNGQTDSIDIFIMNNECLKSCKVCRKHWRLQQENDSPQTLIIIILN